MAKNLISTKKRAKTPIVIQMEITECGSCALAMVLGYYGIHLSLEEIRDKCGVSRSGASLYNILEAARFYGMEAEGVELKAQELHELEVPAILFWDDKHFVVLEGIKRNKVYINDPAFGLNVIDAEELDLRFSQIALEIKPGPSFKKFGKPQSLWIPIKNRLMPFKDAFFYIFVVQFIIVLMGFAQPIFSQLFIDKILVYPFLSWKKEFIFLFFMIICATALMNWLQGKFINAMQTRMDIRFSTQFLWHLLRLPISFFQLRHFSDFTYTMKIIKHIAESLNSDIILAVMNVLLISVYAVAMFQYDALITSVGIAAAVFNFMLLLVVGRVRQNAYARVQVEEAKAYSTALDAVMNIELIKAYGNDNVFFSKIAGYYTKTINASQDIGRKDVWLTTISSLSQETTTVLLLGLGVWRVMHGSLTIGMLFALQALMVMFLKPFNQLVGFGTLIQNLKIDVTRIDDTLNNKLDPLFQDKLAVIASPDSKPRGNLEFRQVSFSYQSLEEPFIQNFDLMLKEGEWVGLVGAVGSGKSTIGKLAASLYFPRSGQILYDGKEAIQYSRQQFMSSLALVDQTIFLFSGTIRDNLTLWNSVIDDATIIGAAKDALIHDEIIALPQGYETLLEEGGRNLSQGQRQRLEIARALISGPQLLILDEATSSIDSLKEGKILKNLRARGLTCLFIAHRLSTIRDCNEIIVLEGGKIAERGTHEQLKQQGGIYQRLLEV